MRKKILIAEQSDAIRSIAETILHQNGYDVITASKIDKAKELIIASKPNMVIIGADLKGTDGNYLYDMLDENELTSSIPILIIADPEGRSLPYPEEVILPRPFNPSDFLERVKLFVGGGLDMPDSGKVKTDDSFSIDSVDDELLDSALGVDNIEVEDSEVLDKTGMIRLKQLKEKPDKKDVFDIHQPDFDEQAKSDKAETVESLMIRDDETTKKPIEKHKKGKFSSTSKIEIASDQYGINEDKEPQEVADKTDNKKTDSEHDYDWFIDEMKKESDKTGVPPEKGSTDSGFLKTLPSDVIEPVNPPKPEKNIVPIENVGEKTEITPGGVDKFINDFKVEMDELNSEPGKSTSTDENIKSVSPSVGIKENVEVKAITSENKIDPAEIQHFCNNLVELLSEKLAKKIVDKIDKDELYRIIQKDFQDLISGSK